VSDFKIVFIHGYTASHLADWYPKITKSLDELGVDYVVPDLPGGRRPHAKEWLEIVNDEVKKSDKPVVLVGHSLGTRTALLYLDQYKQSVKAVFLIAAFANWVENSKRKDGKAYPDFFEYKVDIEAIKKLCTQFVVIHSVDDNRIAYEQGKEIASELGAKLVTLKGRKHMSKLSNAPYILEELREDLKF
jgi:predicted alpha/beta hydrolase family esterase